MRKDSPLIAVMDGDKLIGLSIHCPTAAYPQPDKLELELVRIFEEHKNQQAKKEIENET